MIGRATFGTCRTTFAHVAMNKDHRNQLPYLAATRHAAYRCVRLGAKMADAAGPPRDRAPTYAQPEQRPV